MLALLFADGPADAQPTPPSAAVISGPAAVARLASEAPVVAHARVTRARRAPGAPAGHERFVVQAATAALLKGPAQPARLRWLADVPRGPGGTAPDPSGTEVLVFAAPVPDRPGELRLPFRDAMLPHSPALAARVRALLAEANGPGAPPAVAALASALHVPGTLPGESETRFFLRAADGRPLSLLVTRRPAAPPAWSVSLGELVDVAAPPPAKGTLLWYRLACGLPATLPDAVVEQAEFAAAARADWAVVREGLGRCE